MNIVFIPVYIKFIGIEAYGLISFYSLLYLWFNLLDLGFSPATARLSSRYTGGDGDVNSIRTFISSAEIVMWGISLIIFFSILGASSWISISWVKLESLFPEDVAYSIALMGVVVSFRVVEGIYKAILLGLQKQVQFNIISASIATIRGVGAISVLNYVS